MARHQDGHSFPVELGRRLRELRLRAGLTQADVSRLMGRRGAGSRSWVGKLERGRLGHPKLASVADYLRAVRGRFSEIADILDRYTTQPTVVEQRGTEAVERVVAALPPKVAKPVLSYDIKLRVRRRLEPKPPEPVDERVRRAQRLGAKWLQQRALEELLHALLDRAGVGARTVARKALADHGRKVWGILNRTRKKGRGRREQLLAAKRDWLVGQGVAEGLVRQVEGAVVGLHGQMEDEGALDRLPGSGEAKRLGLLGRGRVARTDEQQCAEEFRAAFHEWETAKNEFVKRVRERCGELVSAAGIGPGPAVRYLNIVLPLFNACAGFEPGSAGWERAADEVEGRFVASGCDAGILRPVRELVLTELAACHASLPPDPRG